MRKKVYIAFLLLLLIATLTFSMRSVYGHTWNQEHNGEAALVYAGWGVIEKVADYIRPGTLKLGGVCGLLVPGWLITEGRMDVYGFATASGQVTGWISWWQKGTLAASGFKWIEIKFQALDVFENKLTEKVVLFVNATRPNPNWEDFWDTVYGGYGHTSDGRPLVQVLPLCFSVRCGRGTMDGGCGFRWGMVV